MRSLFRSTTTIRACLLVIPAFAAGAGVTAAQQLAPSRFDAATVPAPVAAPASAARPATPAADPAPRRSVGRIVAGSAIGGVAGGAAGALAGAAIGSLEGSSDGFISAAEALGVVGLAVGYTAGAALGARKAATIDDARPGLRGLLMFSVLGAVAGGVVWNRIGEGFESEASMSSWYMGAVAGTATHLLITSIAARQRTPAPQAPTPAPGPPER